MRRPGRSVISRIVWTTTIVSAVAMCAMIGTVVLVLSALSSNNIDARLHDQLAAVSATLTIAKDGTVTTLETPDDSIDRTTWIFDKDGRQLEGPRTSSGVQAIVSSLSTVTTETSLERNDRAYLSSPISKNGKVKAVIVVAASLEPYEATRATVIGGLVALGIIVTGGSAGIAAWTIRRTLAPVESMAVRAEDWSEHDLDARFDATGADDEFAHLGRTLNVLLDRVAGALRSEQQLTSELAHELRTPLTAIRGEAELGMMLDGDAETTERLERIVALVDRMSVTIGSLLAIARGEVRPHARTTASALMQAAIEHGAQRPGVVVSVEPAHDDEMSAPFDLSSRALAPLVENAICYAQSAVTLSATVDARTVAITVSDDGPGVDATNPEALFDSGHRAPDSQGAGLGLALSRRVARTLGGDVRVTSASEPTSFTLTLPRF
ncbi:MAG: hypothetical protein JWP10_52 [Nocardioidaceae bacterium]|nr:hypothetical protein [Nocardioidaceae bacterium]